MKLAIVTTLVTAELVPKYECKNVRICNTCWFIIFPFDCCEDKKQCKETGLTVNYYNRIEQGLKVYGYYELKNKVEQLNLACKIKGFLLGTEEEGLEKAETIKTFNKNQILLQEGEAIFSNDDKKTNKDVDINNLENAKQYGNLFGISNKRRNKQYVLQINDEKTLIFLI